MELNGGRGKKQITLPQGSIRAKQRKNIERNLERACRISLKVLERRGCYETFSSFPLNLINIFHIDENDRKKNLLFFSKSKS
jgi:hypothetical protein